jgi:hypothetical protein
VPKLEQNSLLQRVAAYLTTPKCAEHLRSSTKEELDPCKLEPCEFDPGNYSPGRGGMAAKLPGLSAIADLMSGCSSKKVSSAG